MRRENNILIPQTLNKVTLSQIYLFRGKGGAFLSLLITFWCCLLLLNPTISHSQSISNESDSVVTDSLNLEESDWLKTIEALTDTSQIILNLQNLPEAAQYPVNSMNVRDMDVRDLLRGLGREYNINFLVNNDINRKATIHLSRISVLEAVIHICREYGLKMVQSGQVFRVSTYTPPEPVQVIKIPEISMSEDSLFTFDLNDDPLDQVVRHLSSISGKNVMIRNGISGQLTGYLQKVPFELGMNTILGNNGFTIRERDGIYTIDRVGRSTAEGKQNNNRNFWINVDDNQISMDVTNARITDLIQEIAFQMDVNLVTYNLPSGNLTAKTNNLTLEQTFAYLFRGTNVTYRKENDIYVIGDKNTSGIATNRLLRLKHIRADVAMELIPESISQGANIQVVKEQNGLMVIGTNDIILELENFVKEIDYPTPQILIEALVVDLQSSDLFELGVTLGYNTKPDSGFNAGPLATFGTRDSGGKQTGGLLFQGDGETANDLLAFNGNLFGIQNLGKLPRDFYFRIQALDQEGIMNIRSRPQISTLNGHTASIEIGTTQYFILRSSTPLTSPQDVVVQESERFETIEANVSLEITPWVSASGEVTTEIHPEFNSPVGALSPNIPPTINSRVLDSTVRLKDGETIILGGLIQENEVRDYNKVPILGSIPLLGKLFSNRSINKVKSELVIFITPYVFYGDDTDAQRWKELRDELDIDIEKK